MQRFIEGLERRRLMSVTRYDTVFEDEFDLVHDEGLITPSGRMSGTYENTVTIGGKVIADITGRYHFSSPVNGRERGAISVTKDTIVDHETGTVYDLHFVRDPNGVIRVFHERMTEP